MPASPLLITTASEMHAFARSQINNSIALVPTMGALHRGHFGLVQRAQEIADVVVVSIFVNPTQFGPTEDLARYPRQLKADLAGLEQMGGVDVVFAPKVSEMYPDGIDRQSIWVTPSSMADVLCGAFRPGHFRGVATVVAKLFSICSPDYAIFGMKDAQQLVVLKKMVRDLGFQLSIEGVPTIRESDGLALSSRNRFLTKEERQQAVVVSRAVKSAKKAIESGESNAHTVRTLMTEIIDEASLALVQYADVVDAETLQPLVSIGHGQQVLSAVAVFFGGTRLIDNTFSVASSETTAG